MSEAFLCESEMQVEHVRRYANHGSDTAPACTNMEVVRELDRLGMGLETAAYLNVKSGRIELLQWLWVKGGHPHESKTSGLWLRAESMVGHGRGEEVAVVCPDIIRGAAAGGQTERFMSLMEGTGFGPGGADCSSWKSYKAFREEVQVREAARSLEEVGFEFRGHNICGRRGQPCQCGRSSRGAAWKY